MSTRTLPVTVKSFIPFSKMTHEQQVEHLVHVHGLEKLTLSEYLSADHSADHRVWDGTPEQINEHDHDKY